MPYHSGRNGRNGSTRRTGRTRMTTGRSSGRASSNIVTRLPVLHKDLE